MDVTTATPDGAWHDGRATPYVVRIRGLGKSTVRVECHSPQTSSLRAQVVREGVSTPLVMDGVLTSLPPTTALTCSARRGESTVAEWAGSLPWPETTLPDSRLTKLEASRCGKEVCAVLTIDRSHPALVGAPLDVLCELHPDTKDLEFAQVAPWARNHVPATGMRAQLKLGPAPGATVVTCTLDRGLYGVAVFPDTDPSNNELRAVIARATPPSARLTFLDADPRGVENPPCGNCSTPQPGMAFFVARLRNDGPDPISGFGVACGPFAGAFAALQPGHVAAVKVWRWIWSQSHAKHVLPCRAVIWEASPDATPVSWESSVEFP